MLSQCNGMMKFMGRDIFVISTDQEERINVPIGVRELNNTNNC